MECTGHHQSMCCENKQFLENKNVFSVSAEIKDNERAEIDRRYNINSFKNLSSNQFKKTGNMITHACSN